MPIFTRIRRSFNRLIVIGAAVGTVGSAAASADFSVMPQIGDVLTPETATDRYRSDMVRMAVTRFSYPNVNYDVIRPTVRALQDVFGRGHLYAEFVSGETVESDCFDLVLGSAGTYRRFTHRGTRDIASLVSDKFPDPNHAGPQGFYRTSDGDGGRAYRGV